MATIAEQVSAEVLRIQTARNTLRAKGVELGISPSTADLDDVAAAFDGIENKGAVNAQLKEGETYTIPKGYHNGAGVVAGVAGGGNYSLQEKSVTPTKSQQSVTPDSGYYGLSGVSVGAIPEIYQDVSPVTAGAADVLTNKVIVDATGKSVAGTMPNNGAVNKTLDATTKSYTVPKGYHSGSGTVKIVTEEKSATPTKSAQNITPTSGRVLSKVTVAAIPDKYQDVTPVTATAPHVLDGDIFVDATGAEVEGSMPNNGSTSATFNPLTQDSVTIPAGYTSGGEVTMTEDLLNALKAI